MSSLEIAFPGYVLDIIARLNGAGYSAYAVGGCVRDSILGRVPHDWDVTTSAVPERVVSLFSAEPFAVCDIAGIRHGTVLVKHRCGETVEITTYRSEGKYSDHRRPDSVDFTDNIEDDLARRDFTVNAIAAAPSDDGETLVVDPFDGIGDVGRKIIRAVGDPNLRFTEDALRIMRAVRFSSELGFEIDHETLAAAANLAPTLSYVSAERITSELWRMLCGEYFRPCREVLDHALLHICERFYRAFDGDSPPCNPYVRLALMFPHHDTADSLTTVLRFPSRVVSVVRSLLQTDLPSDIADVCSIMREFETLLPAVAEYTEYIDDGSACAAIRGARLMECAGDIEKRGLPYKPSMLAVRGTDLIAVGVPAKFVGRTLDALVRLVAEGSVANEKDALTKCAAQIN